MIFNKLFKTIVENYVKKILRCYLLLISLKWVFKKYFSHLKSVESSHVFKNSFLNVKTFPWSPWLLKRFGLFSIFLWSWSIFQFLYNWLLFQDDFRYSKNSFLNVKIFPWWPWSLKRFWLFSIFSLVIKYISFKDINDEIFKDAFRYFEKSVQNVKVYSFAWNIVYLYLTTKKAIQFRNFRIRLSVSILNLKAKVITFQKVAYFNLRMS